jgi:anti-sigma regulatory factor (Ser/Thr protein kinase)
MASLEISLPRSVDAPGQARTAVSRMCDELGVDSGLRGTLLLLVSEVVSNAVLHSRVPDDATIGLTASLCDDAVRIAVTDAGAGFTPTRRDPARIEGGYGLYLVDKAASRWGVEGSAPTTVWFELSLID